MCVSLAFQVIDPLAEYRSGSRLGFAALLFYMPTSRAGDRSKLEQLRKIVTTTETKAFPAKARVRFADMFVVPNAMEFLQGPKTLTAWRARLFGCGLADYIWLDVVRAHCQLPVLPPCAHRFIGLRKPTRFTILSSFVEDAGEVANELRVAVSILPPSHCKWVLVEATGRTTKLNEIVTAVSGYRRVALAGKQQAKELLEQRGRATPQSVRIWNANDLWQDLSLAGH